MNNDYIFIDGRVPYYQSRLFNEHGVKHAFFTRIGGVSEGAFASLNFALGSGEIKDTSENLYKNHEIAATVFGLTAEDICRSYQTHTSVVEYVSDESRGIGLTKPPFDHGVDGMVTDRQNLLLSIRTADCVPILLCDTERKICGAVHAGWRGTLGGISKNAITLMEQRGARRESIIAAIGPCICADCYEVGFEVRQEFINKNSEYASFFTPAPNNKYMLDLNLANVYILQEAGIKQENISVLNLCTKCNPEHFFSHRLSGAVRGTMSAFIHI